MSAVASRVVAPQPHSLTSQERHAISRVLRIWPKSPATEDGRAVVREAFGECEPAVIAKLAELARDGLSDESFEPDYAEIGRVAFQAIRAYALKCAEAQS